MSTPDLPIVSVVIPAYNMERYLQDAIDSVLSQTWPHLELIVVDDGSTDGTRDVIAAAAAADGRVRPVRKINGGLSSARNAGMEVATGELLCFLDADDAYRPDKLARQVAYLQEHPDIGLVYSDYEIGDGELGVIGSRTCGPPPLPMADLLPLRNPFAPLCPLVRMSVARRVGSFDTGLRSAEDWDWWIRASRIADLGYLAGSVGVYRTHAGQMHHNRPRMRANQQAVVAMRFDPGTRQRRAADAAMLWAEARHRRGRRDVLGAAMFLARAVLTARSPWLMRDVMRWSRYG